MKADDGVTARLRLALQIALTLVVVVGAGVTAAHGSRTKPVGASAVMFDPPAPSGQRATMLFTRARATFPKSAAGWQSPDATLRWTSSYGDAAAGAVTLTTPRSTSTAVSPSVPARAGARYFATAEVRTTAHKGRVALVLEFLGADGRVIPAGTQVGQVFDDRTQWLIRPLTVAGFAPDGAVKTRVVIASLRRGVTQVIDDVQMWRVDGAPAPIVGPLSTRGREIVDGQGRRVVLRGVEVDGMQGATVVPQATMLTQIDVAHAWGANMIRLPVNADRWLYAGCGIADYVARIKQLVARANSYGMLAELDLHTFNPAACGTPRIVAMVDQRGVTFWKSMGLLFGTNPLVAFDLYNEPHDITAQIWRDGGQVTDRGQTFQAVGMQALYDAVRSVHAPNLVFLAGTTWGEVPAKYSLSGTTNLVYAAHVYTCPAGLPDRARAVNCNLSGPGGITDPSARMDKFTPWAARGPIVADEFGFPSSSDGRYQSNLIAYAESHYWSGWVAFAFDGTNAGMFDLVRNTGPVQDPAVSGMGVMAGLVRN